MRLAGRDIIEQFQKRHPQARNPLNRWVKLIEGCKAKDLGELRRTFGPVDSVGEYMVFNVSGRKFRLIVQLEFSLGQVAVKHVLTHAEYSKEKWK